MANEELKVGTRLKKHLESTYIYRIKAIRKGAPSRDLYQVVEDFEPRVSTWVDEDTLYKYWPYIVGATPVAAPDLPGSDGPGGARNVASTVTMQVYGQPGQGKTKIMNDLGEVARRVGKLGLEDLAQEVARIANEIERLGSPAPEPEPEKPHEVLHNWDGCECPYCHSGNIEAGKNDWEGDTAWQRVECLDCGKEWSEVYWLVFADDIDNTQNILAYTDLGDLLLVMPDVQKMLFKLRNEVARLPLIDVIHRLDGILDMIPTGLIERSILGSQS